MDTTMAEDRMAMLETVRKAIADGDVDFLREGVRVLAQAVMEAEVTELTGVPKGERDPEHRMTSRNTPAGRTSPARRRPGRVRAWGSVHVSSLIRLFREARVITRRPGLRARLPIGQSVSETLARRQPPMLLWSTFSAVRW
jgi:hypothetical protein